MRKVPKDLEIPSIQRSNLKKIPNPLTKEHLDELLTKKEISPGEYQEYQDLIKERDNRIVLP